MVQRECHFYAACQPRGGVLTNVGFDGAEAAVWLMLLLRLRLRSAFRLHRLHKGGKFHRIAQLCSGAMGFKVTDLARVKGSIVLFGLCQRSEDHFGLPAVPGA